MPADSVGSSKLRFDPDIPRSNRDRDSAALSDSTPSAMDLRRAGLTPSPRNRCSVSTSRSYDRRKAATLLSTSPRGLPTATHSHDTQPCHKTWHATR
jgi:hypothetical protein